MSCNLKPTLGTKVVLQYRRQATRFAVKISTVEQGAVMRTKSILSMLALTAVTLTFGINEAWAAVSVQVGTPNASFSISDYQPAPANVYVHSDRGRPYYVEHDRRVYMEKKHHGKKHKKDKRHYEDRGHDNGRRGH